MSKIQDCLILSGAMLLNGFMVIGSIYGNLSTYIYSVFRDQDRGDAFDIDPSWMLPIYNICFTVGTFAVEFFKKFGHIPSCIIGAMVYLIGVVTTYFTVTVSTWASTLTLMVLGGLGNSLASICVLAYTTHWFKSSLGLATGMLSAAAGCGGIIFNMVVTAFINPKNLSPDTVDDNLKLFSQSEVIDRVPQVFLLLGGISTAFLTVGLCFLIHAHKGMGKTEEKVSLLDENECKDEKEYTHTFYGSYEIIEPIKTITSTLSLSDSLKLSIVKDENDDNEAHNKETSDCEIGTSAGGLSNSMTPMQVLKCETFYIVQFVLVSETLSYVTVFNYYKLFGQVWIHDDRLLALIGSFSCLLSIFSLVAYGSLTDMIGIKNSLIFHLATRTLFMLFWYFTAMTNKWLYFFWTVITNLLILNQNIIFPIITLKFYGRTYFASNFGLIQSGVIVVCILSPPLFVVILSNFGWFWLFFLNSLSSFFALILIVLKMPYV